MCAQFSSVLLAANFCNAGTSVSMQLPSTGPARNAASWRSPRPRATTSRGHRKGV